jgi:hypothetical protein
MKRAALVLALLVVAVPSFALKGTPDGKRPMRVGVLHTGDQWADWNYDRAAAAIEHEIVAQFRERGIEAWETHRTLKDAFQDNVEPADLYIEVSGGDARIHEIGGVDISGPHVATTLGVIISKAAAEVRVYDGRTLDLVDRFELSKRRTAVVPTSIGLREGPIFGLTVVPIFQHLQYRAAVRDVAKEAAERIAKR